VAYSPPVTSCPLPAVALFRDPRAPATLWRPEDGHAGPSARAGRRVISAGAPLSPAKSSLAPARRSRLPEGLAPVFLARTLPSLGSVSPRPRSRSRRLEPSFAPVQQRVGPDGRPQSAGQRGYVRQKGLWQPLASPASSRVAIGLIPALATSLRELSLALPAARWPSDCSRARQPLPSRRRFKIIAKGTAPESCRPGVLMTSARLLRPERWRKLPNKALLLSTRSVALRAPSRRCSRTPLRWADRDFGHRPRHAKPATRL